MSLHLEFLESETNKTFNKLHEDFYQGKKRKDDLEIKSRRLFRNPAIKKQKYQKSPTNRELSIIQPILFKAFSLLIYKGFKNFDPKTVTVEFQRRNYSNLGKHNGNHFDLVWHTDDYSVDPWKVYTVIFYLRKDSTVRGGNFFYEENEKEYEIKVSEGLCLIFPGYINHSPQHGTGFGCRDSIVVLVKKK